MINLICWALLGCVWVAPLFINPKNKNEDRVFYKEVNKRNWEI